VNFFRINPRQDFASYSVEKTAGEILEGRIIPPHRKIAVTLSEYLGDPPRKPAKHGDIHMSASQCFVRPGALQLFESASRSKLQSAPVTIVGREDEEFRQVWILNFVDCLDVEKTVASPPGGFYKDKIGAIKRPVFDESRWDGSDLFVVPQDPSYCFFCTENFVAQWKAAKFKGAMFSRFLMDPDAIRC
jgi:hypothetical protein